jgi:hypothetical protein
VVSTVTSYASKSKEGLEIPAWFFVAPLLPTGGRNTSLVRPLFWQARTQQAAPFCCRSSRDVCVPGATRGGMQVSYCFQNVLMGTFLTCKYREGEGVFRSDSVTTLAILKEVRVAAMACF